MTESTDVDKQYERELLAEIAGELQLIDDRLRALRESCQSWPLSKQGRWYRIALQLGAARDLCWVVEQTVRDDLSPNPE